MATMVIRNVNISIPSSEFSFLKMLACKMGWKFEEISLKIIDEKEIGSEIEPEIFFKNSKQAMAKQIEKYL